jgi:chlorophyllide a reductase subunit Y
MMENFSPDREDIAPATAEETPVEGMSCASGAEKMKAQAMASGKSELMDRLEADYPTGPHDQPQSMCPAFGSLACRPAHAPHGTVLSGSACCVYGLTFTSHFYGAKRSVGYVPFNSETLVTGKLFEDIRDAVHEMADPEPMTPLSSPISACRLPPAFRCRLLPKEINGVRIVGIDVPGFGVPTHAEAKDVLPVRC